MKNLVDMLIEKGFSASECTDEIGRSCNGLVLRKRMEIVLRGHYRYISCTTFYDVDVFVNRNSGICHVTYFDEGVKVKDRWYDTIGKRTYNAIAATLKCAGYTL